MCFLVVILISSIPTSVYAARDITVSSYTKVASETPFYFKFVGGSTCLNQLTWYYPSSGTNLTLSAYTGNSAQWYQMIEIVNNGNVGHVMQHGITQL